MTAPGNGKSRKGGAETGAIVIGISLLALAYLWWPRWSPWGWPIVRD
jgi:hypothetical protein